MAPNNVARMIDHLTVREALIMSWIFGSEQLALL